MNKPPTKPIFVRLFFEDGIDPSDPTQNAFLKKLPSLENQAWVEWYNGPGKHLINGLEVRIKTKLYNLVNTDLSKDNGKEDAVVKLAGVQFDMKFIDIVSAAFVSEEKRKEEKRKEGE
jgi:hypothetical protein